jgi:tetratricopeptide (TPR) repeat protein
MMRWLRDYLEYPETLLLWQASYLYGARNVELARETYEQVLAIAPDSPQVLFQVADLELRTSEFEQAIARYEQAIEDNLRPGMAYKGIGWARFGLGEYDAALEAFNQAAGLLSEPDNLLYEPIDVADAYNGIGRVYLQQGQCFEAAIAFEQADTSAPLDFVLPVDDLNNCGPILGTQPEPGS